MRILGHELLWLVGCWLAGLGMFAYEGVYPGLLAPYGLVAGAVIYGIAGVVRITVWAVGTMRKRS